jgi:sulfite reductase (NADPH) hemoprotein beta-component
MISDSAAPKPLVANEGIKTASHHLRGNLKREFADTSTAVVSTDSEQLIKFHGTYQQDDRDQRLALKKAGKDKAYSFMLRVRLPGGKATAKQWLVLDTLATQLASPSLRLTTRQTFQFHGVLKGNMKPLLQGMHQVLLDSIAACGDVNRNVMAPVNPEQSPVLEQVYQDAKGWSDYALPKTRAYHEIWLDEELVAGGEPEVETMYGATYLPRKFKTGFAVPPSNDVDVWSQDLGFIAIGEGDTLVGYNITVGGGLGMSHGDTKTYPRLANMLGYCPRAQVVDVAEKVLMVQRDFGDRTNRKHARLKYTIEDRGIDWFRDQVEKRLGYKLGEPRPYQFDNSGDRYGWTLGTDQRWHYTLFIQNGRLLDTDDSPAKTGLREIAKIHTGDFRLTANQNLVIGGATNEQKPRIEALLAQYKLDLAERVSGLRRNSMACVALPTCGLALAESERYLPKLITELDQVIEECGLREDAIVIRMTGCPNGCARPYLGEIGFVGRAPGKYNIYLGAAFDGSRLNKLYKPSVKSEDIVNELAPIIRRYATEREEGERFGDFTIRAGIIKATTEGRLFHEEIMS